MKATKTAFKLIDGVYTEQPFAPNPGLIWTDDNGNNYRAITTNIPFDLNNEKYPVNVLIQCQPKGSSSWLNTKQAQFVADDKSYRNETTGEKVAEENAIEIVKKYFDSNGAEVAKEEALEEVAAPKTDANPSGKTLTLKKGYTIKNEKILLSGIVTSGKYFTKLFGYNDKKVAASIFDFIYQEIAVSEGLSL